MIGLPYSVPENLCDLYIPPVDKNTLVNFHYRHLTVLTGRVIDCLQSINGPSLSAVIAIMNRETKSLVTVTFHQVTWIECRYPCVRMLRRSTLGSSTWRTCISSRHICTYHCFCSILGKIGKDIAEQLA
ncbi:hypothetical protein V1522DRAFT_191127 [Lipomyces starkeyi]